MLHLTSLLTAVLLLSGCSGPLGVLYRDFEVKESESTIEERIDRVLAETGWEQIESPAPNAIHTNDRILNRMLLWRTVASVQVVPIGETHVRVMINPYRYPLLGQRNKLPYMPGVVRRKVVKPLVEAFSEEGLAVTPVN